MAAADLELKRWTRAEYDKLIEQGVFTPEDRIELIDGLLIVAEAQSPSHYTAIRLVAWALAQAFGPGWDVRSQGPIALDETSEPEPDVAVMRGHFLDYVHAHPADPVLVAEITLSSVTLDCRYKSSLYARARCPEYWVLNLVDRALEVRREPALSESAPYGWDYTSVQVFSAGQNASALAAPHAPIAVADLLP